MDNNEITVPYITNRECTNDILTEPLGLDKFVQFRYNLGVISCVTIKEINKVYLMVTFYVQVKKCTSLSKGLCFHFH